EEINLKLREELNLFRGSKSPDDDTTFLALEFAPRQGPLMSLLSFLRLDRDRNPLPEGNAEGQKTVTITRDTLRRSGE
ncbi:MAG: hypothetical protein KDK37_08325, partial [Leptospiraceae bacterium]|nr:hypothetical protein [Leptospiraceae bacterium]